MRFWGYYDTLSDHTNFILLNVWVSLIKMNPDEKWIEMKYKDKKPELPSFLSKHEAAPATGQKL